MSIVKSVYRFFFYPYYNVIYLYKLMKILYKNNFKLLSTLVRNSLIRNYGIFIGFETEIGENLNLPHPQGIILGEGVKIGDNCTIYHQVTMGQKRGNLDNDNDYPIIGNGVTVFAGAKIIGNVKVGDNSVIAANSVVITDVESGSIYAGIPAKKVSENN